MLLYLYDCHREIKDLITADADIDSDEDDDNHGHNTSFWQEVEFMLAVTKPVYKLLRETDTSAAFVSKVYYRMFQIAEEMEKVFENDTFATAALAARQQAIQDIHTKRWEYLHCDYHSAGYALDPNFITHDVNGINNGEVFKDFKTVVGRIHHNSKADYNAAMQQYDAFRDGVGVFGDKKIMSLAETMPAHRWWNMVGGECPELRHVACRVLSKVTSASACERNWSAFEAVQSKKRNRLLPITLKQLVYVRSNLRLQQRRKDTTYATWLADAVDEAVYSDDEDASITAAPVAHAHDVVDVEE